MFTPAQLELVRLLELLLALLVGYWLVRSAVYRGTSRALRDHARESRNRQGRPAGRSWEWPQIEG